MAAVERVVGRRLHQRPELVADARGRAARVAARDELRLQARHQVALLLADRGPQRVRLRAGEAGDVARDLHQLLLVERDAVGRLGDRAQAVVEVAHRGGVALAARVVRDEAHRPGPVEGDQRDDVVELGRAHLLQRLLHALGLELEHAHRLAAGQHVVGLGVVEREVREVDALAPGALDDRDRALEHVERAQSQEVHLQQADLLDRAHRVLRDRLVDALRLPVPFSASPFALRRRRGPPRAGAARSRSAGRSAITTAAAWMELLRTMSSSPRATSTICWACGSES